MSGHLALVTGAGQGIGRAIAERLAHDGTTVAVNDRTASKSLDEVVHATGGVAAPADMAVRADVFAMVENLAQSVGDVSVLVVNHAHMSMAPFVGTDLDEWWRVVDTNLSGAFDAIQAVLPGMRRLGYGRIVLVSSEVGIRGMHNGSAYAASKAGLISMTKALGHELAPEGILVNAVAPGAVDTQQLDVDAEAAETSRGQIIETYSASTPLNRIGTPDEVASAVSLLANPACGAFVGQTLSVNGGSTMGRT